VKWNQGENGKDKKTEFLIMQKEEEMK